MLLIRGATYPGLPPEFAYPAGFGDLVTALLAFVAILLVLHGSRAAKPAAWVFNVLERLTYSWQLRWQLSTTPRLRWDRPIGFPFFRFPSC